MTVNYNELLSALLDSELQGKELEKALDLLNTDQQAKAQLKRYQLTRDVLHGHFISNRVDLTALLSVSLSNEPVFTNKKSQVILFPKQFWRQATSLAVAASVGALAMVGVVSQDQLVPESSMVSVQVPTKTIVSAERWTVGETDIENRLNTYLLDHNEYTGASDVFSYARVVSYSTGQ